MVTGFDESGSVPPADGREPEATEPGQTLAAGHGWAFDEDVSWGYDEPTAAQTPATELTTAGVAGTAGVDLGVAALRQPPRGAPAPAADPRRAASAAAHAEAPTARPGTAAGEPVHAVAPVDVPPPTTPKPTPRPTLPPTPQPTPTATAPAPLPLPDQSLTGDIGVVGGAAAGVPGRSHPARMVLGMATLAAERLRGAAPGGEALLTGVGLVQETAAGARWLARRVLEPASRIASDTAYLASRLPVAGAPLRSLSRSRERVAQVLADARSRGQATVAAGRADAEAFVRINVADTISWAQAKAVPQIVDGLVPHLVDKVVPRILEGTLPEIRAHVLPVVIDDLTNSPQVRDLVLEQGRGVVGDAAEHLRSTTAAADDRVESAFRRLVRAPAPGPTDQAAPGG